MDQSTTAGGKRCERGTVLHASERAAEAVFVPVQPRHAPPDPTAEWLLALQRSAGNQAVARLAGQRRRALARVDVADVRSECERDEKFAQDYREWLKMKISVTGATEADLVRDFPLNRLKETVTAFGIQGRIFTNVHGEAERAKQQLKQARQQSTWKALAGAIEDWLFPAMDLLELIQQEVAHVAGSSTLQTFAKPRLGLLPGIIARIRLLDPAGFERAYLEATKERELPRAHFLEVVDFARGFTVSGQVCLRIGSGASFSSVHPAVHEIVHALSDRAVPGIFGQNLNEGVTELICMRVMDEVASRSHFPAMWKVGNFYSTQRDLVYKLLEDPRLGKATGLEKVFKLYFDTLSAHDSDADQAGKAISEFRDAQTTKATPLLQ
jgi:hypothetical protein